MMINNISFKGYDAAPLKSIFIDYAHALPIQDELRDICKKEEIKLRKAYDGDKWAQDNKCIVERNGKPFLVGSYLPDDSLAIMEGKYDIQGQWNYSFLTGGNTFIGKYPNGEKWLITGEKIRDERKADLSKCYGIKAENMFQIPKPDFHIDLGIRPIGYPNILVNDPEIAEKNLEKLNDGSSEFKELQSSFKAYKDGAKITYASTDEICNSLKKLGFNPIRIGGVYYNGINFMNAIVNKHTDGTMTYISNSSECKNHIYTKLQKVFEQELRKKAPMITNCYFVKGEVPRRARFVEKGYILDSLKYYHGGIHCMTMEEPDFKAWA